MLHSVLFAGSTLLLVGTAGLLRFTGCDVPGCDGSDSVNISVNFAPLGHEPDWSNSAIDVSSSAGGSLPPQAMNSAWYFNSVWGFTVIAPGAAEGGSNVGWGHLAAGTLTIMVNVKPSAGSPTLSYTAIVDWGHAISFDVGPTGITITEG